MLIRAYRVMGHLAADLDPLDLTDRKVHRELKPETYGFTEATSTVESLSTDTRPRNGDQPSHEDPAPDLLPPLRLRVHAHHDPGAKAVESGARRRRRKDICFTILGKKAILTKLIDTEASRSSSTTNTPAPSASASTAREACVPALEQIIKRGGQLGVRDIVIGMAHRGRLNILANVKVEARSWRHLQGIQGRLLQARRRRGLG